MLNTPHSLHVGQRDLKFLHCELYPVSDKWYSLGVQLEVPIETLRCIRSDIHTVAERLLEMLTVWLKCTNPPPTWSVLIEALESHPVGEKHLAKQLRDKYCPKTVEGVTHHYPTQSQGLAFVPGPLHTTQGSCTIVNMNCDIRFIDIG